MYKYSLQYRFCINPVPGALTPQNLNQLITLFEVQSTDTHDHSTDHKCQMKGPTLQKVCKNKTLPLTNYGTVSKVDDAISVSHFSTGTNKGGLWNK